MFLVELSVPKHAKFTGFLYIFSLLLGIPTVFFVLQLIPKAFFSCYMNWFFMPEGCYLGV